MTVKGLEPELRSMTEQHELEIKNLRNAHMEELQNMDLRAIRRANQQLEQLRIELTDSHEKLLSEEKELIRSRYLGFIRENYGYLFQEELRFKVPQVPLLKEIMNNILFLYRYEAKLNEQEALFDEKQRKFFEELQREKEKFSHEQLKRDAERDEEIQRVTLDFNVKFKILIFILVSY